MDDGAFVDDYIPASPPPASRRTAEPPAVPLAVKPAPEPAGSG